MNSSSESSNSEEVVELLESDRSLFFRYNVWAPETGRYDEGFIDSETLLNEKRTLDATRPYSGSNWSLYKENNEVTIYAYYERQEKGVIEDYKLTDINDILNRSFILRATAIEYLENL
jgi:hypothetical protein